MSRQNLKSHISILTNKFAGIEFKKNIEKMNTIDTSNQNILWVLVRNDDDNNEDGVGHHLLLLFIVFCIGTFYMCTRRGSHN